MEKRKVSAKVLLLFMVLILMFSFSLTVSAKAVEFEDIVTNYASFSDSSDQPYGFDKTVSVTLTSSSYTKILTDSNWWNEDAVLVQFVSSGAPTSISVYVRDDGDNQIGPKTINLGNSAGFLMKKAGNFSVYAKVNGGSNGKCDIRIILTTST